MYKACPNDNKNMAMLIIKPLPNDNNFSCREVTNKNRIVCVYDACHKKGPWEYADSAARDQTYLFQSDQDWHCLLKPNVRYCTRVNLQQIRLNRLIKSYTVCIFLIRSFTVCSLISSYFVCIIDQPILVSHITEKHLPLAA